MMVMIANKVAKTPMMAAMEISADTTGSNPPGRIFANSPSNHCLSVTKIWSRPVTIQPLRPWRRRVRRQPLSRWS